MDTTNLRQVEGGTIIKQADRSSVLSFILQDAKGREVKLDGQSAEVALYTNHGKFWETSTKVKGAEVSFSLPGNLAVDDYLLDISVAGYVFPSDRDLIIRVTQGFKDLPDKVTAENSKRTLEQITADVQKQSDKNLKKNIEIITEKKDVFSSYIDTKATEVSTTGDKYLKDIEATTIQNIDDIKQVSKTEADKLKSSSTEAIKLIGSKKDQALQEIDTKAKTIADAVKADVEGLINDKVDKEPGKGLSDNNFTNAYKSKLDTLDKDIDKKLEPKADKTKVDEEVQKLKDLIYDSETKYQDDMIYILDPYIEAGEVKFRPKEIGKLLENDFLKVPVKADKMHFRVKSSSQGIILLYSLADEDLQYAIHVYPNIKDYKIDFGKTVNEELIFTSVTMPEDKVSVIREEGFSGN